MQATTPPSDEQAPSRSLALSQDDAYLEAIAHHGRDIARFVAGYERDLSKREELLQEVHVGLWQSLAGFRAQCSLRTWVYRVAHNIGSSHIQRSLKAADRHYVALEELESMPSCEAGIESAERRLDLARIFTLIHRLQPADREVMLLYLEDLDAASIGEVTGLSARNVATKVHRIKKLLTVQMNAPEAHP